MKAFLDESQLTESHFRQSLKKRCTRIPVKFTPTGHRGKRENKGERVAELLTRGSLISFYSSFPREESAYVPIGNNYHGPPYL